MVGTTAKLTSAPLWKLLRASTVTRVRRPDNAKYVADILRGNGYGTLPLLVSGTKQLLGRCQRQVLHFRWPANSGFDKFYGFIGGETNQWDPMIFDGTTVVEKGENKDYLFTDDMTNQAISYVRTLNSLTPDKPFFVYYAPGAVHAPHHAPKSYIEKYKGKFADGWQALRQRTPKRQIQMGLSA